MRDRKDVDAPSLAWLLISAIGGALAALVVAGVFAGRLGAPITGALLLGAALLGALPRLVQLARGRWVARWTELAAALLALLAVGFAGLAPAWPALLPLGLSVDAVHHYQLVHWIAEHQAFPPLDRGSAGLLGEMNAYPPGFALVALAAASLISQAPLTVLYPVVALLGALSAALVVLLASASGELRMKNEEWRKRPHRSILHSAFCILHFFALMVGPLLLLAHRVYTLEAYTNQSYYAMVLGVFLVLLAAGYLMVEPRLTPAGAAQLGLALAALVGVYPLWVAIPAVLAGLAIVFAPRTSRPQEIRARAAEPTRQTPEGVGYGYKARLRGLIQTTQVAFAPVAEGISPTAPQPPRISSKQAAPEITTPGSRRLLFLPGGERGWEMGRRVLLLGLALLPPVGLALIDLPQRLRVGQVVLAHQGLVPLPTAQNLVPLLLALPGAAILVVVLLRALNSPLRDTSRPFVDQPSVRLLVLAGIWLVALIGLFGAAQAGRAAIYHAYKLLFVLAPVGAAIVGAAMLRLTAIARPWARGLALATAAVLLASTGSFQIMSAPAIQPLNPDVVAAASWLTTNRPRDASKAIVVGAPAGPLTYWLQVGLLGQRRDKAELAMRAFDAPSATPEGWIVDEELPKFVLAAQLDQPPPGAEVVARFGAAAVLRRSSQFDVARLDPLLIRYRSYWHDDRLTTDIELLRRRAGHTPLLELRLEQAGRLIASFPLQPDDTRARPQYLGLELWPATLGGRGYINRDAFPEFAPPPDMPSGTFTLLLRLTLDGSTLDERTLASFERTATGQIVQLPAGGGELVYMRRTQLPDQVEHADARFSDTLRLTGWSESRRIDDEDTLAVALRWEALRPIDRSLFAEVQVLDLRGQVVADSIALPQSGFYPTWRWRPGESVADEHRIALPANLAPGTYQLRVQMRDFGVPGGSAHGVAQLGEFVVE